MVEAFAMIAGTALEYGVKMLAWLKKKKQGKKDSEHSTKLMFYISCSLPLFSHIPKGHKGLRISQNLPAAADLRFNPTVRVC